MLAIPDFTINLKATITKKTKAIMTDSTNLNVKTGQ
jgi:hypothetical protein